ASLAFAPSEEDNDAVAAAVEDARENGDDDTVFWIGLYSITEDGVDYYYWDNVDDEATWFNWEAGHEDDTDSDENQFCVAMSGSKKHLGEWNDKGCSSNYGFVCEYVEEESTEESSYSYAEEFSFSYSVESSASYSYQEEESSYFYEEEFSYSMEYSASYSNEEEEFSYSMEPSASYSYEEESYFYEKEETSYSMESESAASYSYEEEASFSYSMESSASY
ncbi:unnamed protein product, partial [Heterosigma akashiwo]